MAHTDHKSLLGLFGRECPIPCNANVRIQRWALLLPQCEYEPVHKSGKDNVVVGILYRLPMVDELKFGTPAEYVRLVEHFDCSDISFLGIQKLTQNDGTLKQLVSCLKYDWSNDVDAVVKEFSPVRSDLSLHNDVVLYRNLVPVAY